MAKVQIDDTLFVDLIKYHLAGLQTQDIANRIAAALNVKMEAMHRRDLYTKSKTAQTAEDRDAARQTYLDAAGIHSDFRW